MGAAAGAKAKKGVTLDQQIFDIFLLLLGQIPIVVPQGGATTREGMAGSPHLALALALVSELTNRSHILIFSYHILY